MLESIHCIKVSKHLIRIGDFTGLSYIASKLRDSHFSIYYGHVLSCISNRHLTKKARWSSAAFYRLRFANRYSSFVRRWMSIQDERDSIRSGGERVDIVHDSEITACSSIVDGLAYFYLLDVSSTLERQDRSRAIDYAEASISRLKTAEPHGECLAAYYVSCELSLLYAKEGAWVRAFDAIDAACKIGSGNYFFTRRRIKMYVTRRDYGRAMAMINDAIKDGGSTGELLMWRGLIYSRFGLVDLAKWDFLNAADQLPESPEDDCVKCDALRNMVRMYNSMGLPMSALQSVNLTACRGGRVGFVYYEMAESYALLDMGRLAVAFYRRAAGNGTGWRMLYDKARTFKERRSYSLAVALFRLARANCPEIEIGRIDDEIRSIEQLSK